MRKAGKIALILFLAGVSVRAEEKKNAADTTKTTRPPIAQVPQVKEGEFALFREDKYIVFKTFDLDGLKLYEGCKATSGKPSCQAYKAGLAKKPGEPPWGGNPASDLCRHQGGVNLIAFNHKRQEYNFCEFEDKSLVNSWTLYYKLEKTETK